MNNIELRKNLLTRADGAFLELLDQVRFLFNAIQGFCDLYCNDPNAADIFKAKELNTMINDINVSVRQLGAEILRWEKSEEGMLSWLGVEIEILHELYCTMKILMLFFIRENIDLQKFSLYSVEDAYKELIHCNRLLNA